MFVSALSDCRLCVVFITLMLQILFYLICYDMLYLIYINK